MRILHTSDWHLGRVLGERSLLEDQLSFLRFVVETIAADPHDVLVVAGDVFDRSIPPETAIDAWSRFLVALREVAPRIPVVVIAGNHDSASRLATASDVLATVGIHIRGHVRDLESPIRLRSEDTGDVDFFPIPFLWPGALSTHRDGDDVPLGTQVSALTEAIARIEGAIDRSVPSVAIAHCFALGGVVSDSERPIVGNATSIDASLFERFDYVALGHLHRGQRVTERSWYSGSPLPYSFSEAGDTKAMLSVTVTRGASPRIRSIPTPGRKMKVLRGTLDELLAAPEHEAHVDSFVRAELTDRAAPLAPMALLRRRFPNALDVEWVGREERYASIPDARIVAQPRRDLLSDFEAFEASLGHEVKEGSTVRAIFDELREAIRDEDAS